jgi:hypothetical protein
MARVKVTIELEVPDVDATDKEIGEWLMFELHYNGDMSGNNPLCNECVEPDDFEWEFV